MRHSRKTYDQEKQLALQYARGWIDSLSNAAYDTNELTYYKLYFARIGKRYGLINEFKKIGVIESEE